MMTAIDPPTFTPLGPLKMARYIPRDYGYFAVHPPGSICQTLAFLLSLAIFALSLFFFSIALCTILRRPGTMTCHLTWYGLVFPNVGLLSTMGLLETMLPSAVVMWVASVGTALLRGAYIVVAAAHARATWTRSKVLW